MTDQMQLQCECIADDVQVCLQGGCKRLNAFRDGSGRLCLSVGTRVHKMDLQFMDDVNHHSKANPNG